MIQILAKTLSVLLYSLPTTAPEGQDDIVSLRKQNEVPEQEAAPPQAVTIQVASMIGFDLTGMANLIPFYT